MYQLCITDISGGLPNNIDHILHSWVIGQLEYHVFFIEEYITNVLPVKPRKEYGQEWSCASSIDPSSNLTQSLPLELRTRTFSFPPQFQVGAAAKAEQHQDWERGIACAAAACRSQRTRAHVWSSSSLCLWLPEGKLFYFKTSVAHFTPIVG